MSLGKLNLALGRACLATSVLEDHEIRMVGEAFLLQQRDLLRHVEKYTERFTVKQTPARGGFIPPGAAEDAPAAVPGRRQSIIHQI